MRLQWIDPGQEASAFHVSATFRTYGTRTIMYMILTACYNIREHLIPKWKVNYKIWPWSALFALKDTKFKPSITYIAPVILITCYNCIYKEFQLFCQKTMHYTFFVLQCNAGLALYQMNRLLTASNETKLALLGEACSHVTQPLAATSHFWNIPQAYQMIAINLCFLYKFLCLDYLVQLPIRLYEARKQDCLPKVLSYPANSRWS